MVSRLRDRALISPDFKQRKALVRLPEDAGRGLLERRTLNVRFYPPARLC